MDEALSVQAGRNLKRRELVNSQFQDVVLIDAETLEVGGLVFRIESSSDAFATAAFAVILGVVVGLFFSRAHRVLGPVVGGGLSFLAAPWVIPAVMAGAVSLVLVGLLSKLGSSSGSRRRGDGSAFDGTWFSTQQGGWGSGGFGGSFGGSGGFSGGGGDFGGGGASGDW